MAATEKRISQKIRLPSVALSKALLQAIFDKDAFEVFLENTASALKSNGVELDKTVSDDALMRLRFLVVRAHDVFAEKKMDATKFENLLGLEVAHFGGSDEVSREQQSESNRGSNTEWSKQDALTNTRSDHWSTTKFDGREFLRHDDRFIRAPLLDALNLGMVIAKIEARLKEIAA